MNTGTVAAHGRASALKEFCEAQGWTPLQAAEALAFALAEWHIALREKNE
jgi:hypothetical protein